MAERLVFLLEDNPARLQAMLEVLRAILPAHQVHVEDDAARASEWFSRHKANVEMISLDHDLDSVPRQEETAVDHGCGRDLSRVLATCEPTCPVIVHTTNTSAGTDMILDLQRAGWPVFRVYPFNDHEWVKSAWREMIVSLIGRGYLA